MPTTGLGPLHVPPTLGVPPSCANKFTAPPTSQTVILPFVPAFVGVFSVTVTVALALMHGAVAFSVYV